MSLSLALLVTMAVMYACGVYLLLERSMTRVLLGFLLVGNATNLLLITVAGAPGLAPIFSDGTEPTEMTDPLPQALILTAIVITFAVSAFLLALIYRSWRLGQADEVADDEADVALREEAAHSEMTDDAESTEEDREFEESEFADADEDAAEPASDEPFDAEDPDAAAVDTSDEHAANAAAHPAEHDKGIAP